MQRGESHFVRWLVHVPDARVQTVRRCDRSQKRSSRLGRTYGRAKTCYGTGTAGSAAPLSLLEPVVSPRSDDFGDGSTAVYWIMVFFVFSAAACRRGWVRLCFFLIVRGLVPTRRLPLIFLGSVFLAYVCELCSLPGRQFLGDMQLGASLLLARREPSLSVFSLGTWDQFAEYTAKRF